MQLLPVPAVRSNAHVLKPTLGLLKRKAVQGSWFSGKVTLHLKRHAIESRDVFGYHKFRRRMHLASGGYRSGMWLTIPQCMTPPW